jgi:D-alanyl-D-alanine carboxypeptidase
MQIWTLRRDTGAGLRSASRAGLSLIVALLLVVQFATPAAANPRFAAVVVDAKSGNVVFSRNADATRFPASLTKIMTLYLLFEDMKAGRVTRDTRFPVSAHAAGRPPSKIGLRPGQSIRAEDAARVLITKSANDVAAVVAEALSGSESAFAQRMTRKARELGMTRTTFRNASGLPHSEQVTTARDMATLGLRIQRDFPDMYGLFSLRSFTYAGQAYRNHNGLLGQVRGMDGIKTGFIRASGFNLTAAVERDRKRIVAVVMGGRTAATRNRYMAGLIEDVFKTANLTSSGPIAAHAGNPPGLDAAQLKLASLPPPLPRAKPEFGDTSQEHPVLAQALSGEGSEDDTVTVDQSEPVDEAAKASLAMAIAKLSGDIHPGGAAGNAPEPSDARVAPSAAKSPDTQQETVLLKSGWTIQVGAFPTQEGAQSRLDHARSSGIALLSNKPGFTMATPRGDRMLYRARFSGFTEQHAREACKSLSEKGLECLALAP